MRIGIDISQVAYSGTGVARFTEGLIKAICRYDDQNEWVFFFSSLRNSFNRELKKNIENKNFKLVRYRFPPTLLSWLWNKLHFFDVEKLIGNADWFITSDWTQPPSVSKIATVVHDLVFMRYPETQPELIKNTQKNRLNWVVKETSIIFADSYATKKDLIEMLELSKSRIKVNYPGVEIKKPDSSAIKKTLAKFQLSKPFILTVSKIEPRKNLSRLIEAYEKLQNKNIDLVVVGQEGWGKELKVTAGVRLLGYISDDELACLYASCLVFVYPSIWEGFGYPVVEAMRLGAPVCCSDTSSLSEIGQDAALLFNPLKTEEIKQALQKMITSPDLRKSYSSKGKKRSEQFNWKSYYEEMIRTFKEFKINS